MASRKRQRDTIATVPVTPKALLGQARPVRGAAVALAAADEDDELPTQPVDLGRPLTLAVPSLSEEEATGERAAAASAMPARGHTVVADAIGANIEAPASRPRRQPQRFTQPLTVAQSRPRLWTLAAGAVVVLAAVVTVLELAL
jgi:hypothetical protein